MAKTNNSYEGYARCANDLRSVARPSASCGITSWPRLRRRVRSGTVGSGGSEGEGSFRVICVTWQRFEAAYPADRMRPIYLEQRCRQKEAFQPPHLPATRHKFPV